MRESDPGQFEDLALKAAVKRAWPQERAPLDLAVRMRQAMREAVPAAEPAGWRLPRWTAYAAAAMVALVVGFYGAGFLSDSNQTMPGGGFAQASVLPASYLASLVSRHDSCRERYCDTQSPAPDANLFEIQKKLQEQTDRPLWVVDPRQEGWQFRHAGLCTIDADASTKVRGPHLMYTKNGQQKTLSVFSVPFEGSCRAKPGETFIDDGGQHHVVFGFVEDGELHCLIGHSPDGTLTPEELKAMGTKYRVSMQTIRLPHNVLIARAAYVR